MDDREILQWDKRLTDQARRGWDNYKHLHIDLSTARIDQSYRIAGEYLYVEESSSIGAIAKIKLNRTNNDALDLKKGVKIETVFIEIFITNEAIDNEWLDLVFGINFEYYQQQAQVQAEAQPCKIITNVAADANTVGATNVCNKVLIRAFTTNTGLVWVDFHVPAVENQCYPLDAGDAISINLRNTDQINALFKVANEDVAVVYEV